MKIEKSHFIEIRELKAIQKLFSTWLNEEGERRLQENIKESRRILHGHTFQLIDIFIRHVESLLAFHLIRVQSDERCRREGTFNRHHMGNSSNKHNKYARG